jgi:hypothetical protein
VAVADCHLPRGSSQSMHPRSGLLGRQSHSQSCLTVRQRLEGDGQQLHGLEVQKSKKRPWRAHSCPGRAYPN